MFTFCSLNVKLMLNWPEPRPSESDFIAAFLTWLMECSFTHLDARAETGDLKKGGGSALRPSQWRTMMKVRYPLHATLKHLIFHWSLFLISLDPKVLLVRVFKSQTRLSSLLPEVIIELFKHISIKFLLVQHGSINPTPLFEFRFWKCNQLLWRRDRPRNSFI